MACKAGNTAERKKSDEKGQLPTQKLRKKGNVIIFSLPLLWILRSSQQGRHYSLIFNY